MGTPEYIKSLLAPTTKAPQGRKVWSIDLQQVWLPFFTATNAMGDTAIPSAAIGAPLRLAYDKTGAVRFSQTGRPTVRVAKEIADNVKLVRDNFTANLLNYAGSVMRDNEEGFKAQVELARKAGEPILKLDSVNLSSALQAKVDAEAVVKDTQAVVSEAEAVVKEAGNKPKTNKSKELVHA